MTKDRSSVSLYYAFLSPTRGLPGTEARLCKCRNDHEFRTSAGATLSPTLLWYLPFHTTGTAYSGGSCVNIDYFDGIKLSHSKKHPPPTH